MFGVLFFFGIFGSAWSGFDCFENLDPCFAFAELMTFGNPVLRFLSGSFLWDFECLEFLAITNLELSELSRTFWAFRGLGARV